MNLETIRKLEGLIKTLERIPDKEQLEHKILLELSLARDHEGTSPGYRRISNQYDEYFLPTIGIRPYNTQEVRL